MTQSTAKPRSALPSLIDVLWAQLSLIAAARKIGACIAYGYIMVQTVLLATRGVVVGVMISADEGATTISLGSSVSELTDMQPPVDEGQAALLFAAFALNLWGFFWPFKVWRGERPSLRGYHWSMPVDRAAHDLARVAAGAAWLILVIATVVSATVISAALAGNTASLSEMSPIVWVQVLTAPMLPYLAVSAVLVRAERPALWIFGVLGMLALAWTLATAAEPGIGWGPVRTLLLEPAGFLGALMGPLWMETVLGRTPPAAAWALGFAAWMLVSLVALLLAAGILTPGRRRGPARAIRSTGD